MVRMLQELVSLCNISDYKYNPVECWVVNFNDRKYDDEQNNWKAWEIGIAKGVTRCESYVIKMKLKWLIHCSYKFEDSH